MMKKIIIGIETLFFVFYANKQIWGQEKKNSFIVSGIAAHYIGIEDHELLDPPEGYYTYPVDPGFELLYFRKIRETVFLGTGYNYQTGKIASNVNGIRRFQFSEQNLSIVIRKEFTLRGKTYLYACSGFYFGRNNTITAESLNKNGDWHQVYDMELSVNYYDDNNFIDFNVDLGYCYSFNKWSEISIAPFLKYRINETWLNYHESRIHYGIKLSYNLKF